jgi:hypothetical protein
MPRENQDILVPYVYFSVGICQRDGEQAGRWFRISISYLPVHAVLLFSDCSTVTNHFYFSFVDTTRAGYIHAYAVHHALIYTTAYATHLFHHRHRSSWIIIRIITLTPVLGPNE